MKCKITLALFVLCLWSFADRPDQFLAININVVKNDIVKYGSAQVPWDFVMKARESIFGVFYFKQNCLVHLAYKDIYTEALMKSSVIAVYEMDHHSWKFVKVIPYHYQLVQVAPDREVFISDNQLCYGDGSCSNYTELSLFRDEDMVSIYSHTGFDSTFFYHRLLSLDQLDEAQAGIGRTIFDIERIGKISTDGNGLKSYEIQRETGVLEAVTDSLLIRKVVKKKLVKVR